MSYLRLKGITEIGHSTLCDQLKVNVVEFFNWGLLEVGAFSNVSLGQLGSYGGDMSQLRLSSDPNFIYGQVWESFRQDWVWQSGLDYSYQPKIVSGVYVDDYFFPSSTTGIYQHSIDYKNGRVVFSNPINTSSKVQVEFSYRTYTFYTSDEPWFREVIFNSHRVDDSQFLQQGSGIWSTLSQNRFQLPSVVVETVPRRDFIPKQLGGGMWVYQDVIFHILSENPWDRDKLIDIITYQKNKTILSFDKNRLYENNAYPLDDNGDIKDGALSYPDLVKPSGEGGYFWKKIYINDMKTQEVTSTPPLYRAIVRGTFETDFSNL